MCCNSMIMILNLAAKSLQKFPVIILLSALASSCVERYYPDIHGRHSPKLVVSALINDYDPLQTVALSKSSSLDSANVNPFMGCWVSISDNSGNIFDFTESDSEPGIYHCLIARQFFVPGTEYTLHISTPDGNEYSSDPEKLFSCPPVDSAKYKIVHNPTSVPGVTEDGIQFYVDL